MKFLDLQTKNIFLIVIVAMSLKHLHLQLLLECGVLIVAIRDFVRRKNVFDVYQDLLRVTQNRNIGHRRITKLQEKFSGDPTPNTYSIVLVVILLRLLWVILHIIPMKLGARIVSEINFAKIFLANYALRIPSQVMKDLIFGHRRIPFILVKFSEEH